MFDRTARFLRQALEGGSPAALDSFFRDRNLAPNRDCLVLAADLGVVDIFDHLIKAYNLRPSEEALAAAAGAEQIAMFEQIVRRYRIWPGERTLACCARRGRVKMLTYLLAKYLLKPTEGTLAAAAHCRKSPLALEFCLRKNTSLSPHQGLCRIAATYDCLGVMDWLFRWGIKPTMDLALLSAEKGALDVLLLLLSKLKEKPTETLLSAAAKGGQLHVLTLLVKRFGLRPNSKTLHAALRAGNWITAEAIANDYGVSLSLWSYKLPETLSA